MDNNISINVILNVSVMLECDIIDGELCWILNVRWIVKWINLCLSFIF